MSIFTQAIRGAGWLSICKFFSQIISWTSTVVITRILSSEDYGLMEMATIFTGYIAFFVEFGIGAALINKDELEQKELSSIFWFMLLWGTSLSLCCLILAPITVELYNEPRIYHLTQSTGLLFILSSLMIVPRSILHRELRFKEVGVIEITTIIISSAVSIILATLGAGPWTLVGAFIAREASNTIMLFIRSKFIPDFTFSFTSIKPLLSFGVPVVLSTSLYYVYTKADRFFGGLTFGAEELGYYVVALQFAAIPVEKIVSLLQSVLYPTLSKLKNNKEAFNILYLAFVSLITFITFPLFIGGILTAENVVSFLLGEKWEPIIVPLQLLLASQLFMALAAPNGLLHAARGKPKWNLIFNTILTPTIAFAFFLSSKGGQVYFLAIPWISIFPLFQLAFIHFSNRQLGISFLQYTHSILHPIIATVCMSAAIIILFTTWSDAESPLPRLVTAIVLGACVYGFYFLTFGKIFIRRLKSLKKYDTEMLANDKSAQFHA